MNCLRCGQFIKTKSEYETFLCEKCYEEFMKWSFRRFTYLAKKVENPLELWLSEVKKHG